jgi:hypothetical protein
VIKEAKGEQNEKSGKRFFKDGMGLTNGHTNSI